MTYKVPRRPLLITTTSHLFALLYIPTLMFSVQLFPWVSLTGYLFDHVLCPRHTVLDVIQWACHIRSDLEYTTST